MKVEKTIVTRAQIWPTQVMPMLRRSYDLLLLIGFALLLPSLSLLPLPLRVPLGLAGVLIAPGYTLAAVLFPRRDDLDGAARVAVCLGLSIAVLPVLVLLLAILPWGIHLFPITISLSVWILLFSNIALWVRRFFVSADIVYMPPTVDLLVWRHSLSKYIKTRYTIGALAFSAGLITGTIFLLTSNLTARPTEFYLLGQEGLAENYPREVTPGEELTATIGIVNQEPDEATYRIQVWVKDAWSSKRRTLVAERGPLAVSPNNKTELPVSWHMPWVGNDQKVEFLLFKGVQPEPYRQLWLWVNVVERR